MGALRAAVLERGRARFRPAVVRSAGLCAAGLLFAGCSNWGVTERVWSSAGFSYTSSEKDPVCPAVLNTLSDHRTAIVNFLGLDDVSVGVVRYRKFSSRQDLAAHGHCSQQSSACFFRQFGIESSAAFEQHELIHAYLAYLGDSHKLLEEGVAEALTCGETIPGRSRLTLQDAWSKQQWSAPRVESLRGLYQAGAWFVGYLLKHFEPTRFTAFYASVGPDSSLGQVKARFEAVYQRDLTTVWHNAMAQTAADAPCVYAYACSFSPLPVSAAAASSALECDAQPRYATALMDGITWLTAPPSEQNAWRLGACMPSTPLPYESLRDESFATTRGQEHELMLAPGRYWLSTNNDGFGTRPVSRSLLPEHECEFLEPLVRERLQDVTVSVSATSLALLSAVHGAADQPEMPGLKPSDTAVPNAALLPLGVGGPTWAISLDQAELAGARVVAECSPNLTIELCETCDYTACQPVCLKGETGTAPVLGEHPRVRLTVLEDGDVWFRLRRISR